MRPFNQMEGAFLLAYENNQRDGLEDCIVKLSRGVDSPREQKRLKRKARAYLRRLKALALERDKAKYEIEVAPIRAIYNQSLDPNRKAKCKIKAKRVAHF